MSLLSRCQFDVIMYINNQVQSYMQNDLLYMVAYKIFKKKKKIFKISHVLVVEVEEDINTFIFLNVL